MRTKQPHSLPPFNSHTSLFCLCTMCIVFVYRGDIINKKRIKTKMCFITDEKNRGFYLFIGQILCNLLHILDFLTRDRHTLSGIFKNNFYRLCG